MVFLSLTLICILHLASGLSTWPLVRVGSGERTQAVLLPSCHHHSPVLLLLSIRKGPKHSSVGMSPTWRPSSTSHKHLFLQVLTLQDVIKGRGETFWWFDC